MAFNGSGTFLINSAGQPVVAGTVISSTTFNSLTADLATGLSTVITKDGQTTVTANIPMASFKFTGLGVGSAAGDSANLSQVQSTVTKLLAGVSGADTVTATASPTLAAYAAGQMFYFVAAGDNTTSVTLNIDALGAKAVTRDGSVALAAADIKSGEVVVVVYDGTRFQVVSQLNSAGDARFANVSIASSLYVGGVSTFVGNAGFSANVSIASALSVGGVAAITGATTIGGNLTLSGGTANGVAFLNASKVVTSGTALAFDGTNFGVGTAGNAINHRSVIYFGGVNAVYQMIANGSTGLGAANGLRIGLTAAGLGELYAPTSLTTYINNSTATTLTSTGLGIGTTSPAGKVDSVSNATAAFAARASTTGANQTVSAMAAFNSDASLYALAKYDAVQHIWGYSGTTEGMRLDSSGNVGIGTSSPTSRLHVVSSTPNSGNQSLFINQQYGNTGDSSSQIRMTLNSGAGGGYLTAYDADFQITHNSEFIAGSNFVARSTTASALQQASGVFVFYSNQGLTAGNAFTPTERMRLDSSGNLLVGTSSGQVAATVVAFRSSAATSCVGAWNSATSGDNLFVEFNTEATATLRGSIDYNRAGGLVRYNTTSDYRAKDILGTVQNSGATIDALKVYEGVMKGATESRPMLIAHEAQEYAPYAVSGVKDEVKEDGTPKYQQMDVSALVPLLLAELQSLRKRVAELEAK